MLSLKNRKAPGLDNIDARTLKCAWPIIKDRIVSILQKIWDTNVMPASLSLATLVPVLKKGDPSMCSNYRGISLLSSLYKIIEKIILARIGKYLERSSSEQQAEIGRAHV